jgi:hypothetical protein
MGAVCANIPLLFGGAKDCDKNGKNILRAMPSRASINVILQCIGLGPAIAQWLVAFGA